MSSIDDLMVQIGLKYAKQVAKEHPQSTNTVAKALAVLAGHLVGSCSLSTNEAQEWFLLGVKTAAAGFSIEVALNHLRTQPQSTTQTAPNREAQAIGEKMFISLHEAVPDDDEIDIDTVTDAAAVAMVHFAKSLDLPMQNVIQRMGVSSVLVEHRLAQVAAALDTPLLN